jgi:hypothetical protein
MQRDTFEIYLQPEKHFLQLTDSLNSLLPAWKRIGYDKEYLGGK